MPTDSRHKRGQRGTTLILFTLMLPALLIPIVGLGIDATMLYIVQAKLSAAVDGAALGAGRLLGTPADPKEIAGEFLNANFRAGGTSGFWGAYNLNPTITYVNGITKTITVNATANVPLLFSRVFHQTDALVSATATATRADSRVVLIIDRSYSMTNDDGTGTQVINDVKSYAQAFTQQFTEGTDEVGLVVFDGSAVVGYPTGTWTSVINTLSTGGPDTTFNDGTAHDMVNQIGAITANGPTGTAEALTIAYIELQKAHMRDLKTFGVDNRLNSIVLFTDGMPTAASVYLNNPANSNAQNMIKSTSLCANKTNNSDTVANRMFGWIGAYGPDFPPLVTHGVFGQIATRDPNLAHNAVWWMPNSSGDWNNLTQTDGGREVSGSGSNTAPFNGCRNLYDSATSIGSVSNTDLSKIPDVDMWGNKLTIGTNNGYKNSHLVGASATSVFLGTMLDQSKPAVEYNWELATWDAADWAAKSARTDANRGSRVGDTSPAAMPIAIYAVGYTGNGGCDDGLLRRIANDKSSSDYDATQATGMYVQASNKAALASAFSTIASAILRLSN